MNRGVSVCSESPGVILQELSTLDIFSQGLSQGCEAGWSD